MRYLFSIFILSLCSGSSFKAQEYLGPLYSNLNLLYPELKNKAEIRPGDQVSAQRSSTASLSLPFVDDFYYSTLHNAPDPKLWRTDSSVYVNSSYGIDPPSIGVATFDGLNRYGYPYDPELVNMTLSRNADTLMSQPINLYTTGTKTLFPTDKVALSFYYQARGNGESPESSDSLIVKFYKPRQNAWEMVWHSRGQSNPNTIPTEFTRAFIKIEDTAYFHDGFRFMIRNRATTNGNFDHWNVDYVYLDQGRDSIADTTYNDITFGYVPTPFLQDYSSMPWQQYVSAEMATANKVHIANRHLADVNIYYDLKIYDKEKAGNQVYFYTGDSWTAEPFEKKGYVPHPPFANPAGHANFTYDFPTLSDSASYRIKHYIYRSGSQTDFIKENDTIYQFHHFKNYYAFDDGSAEGGYYLHGPGAQLAVKVRVNVTDTLRALRIYFDPAGPIKNASSNLFRLFVWSGNGTPISVLYDDSVTKKVSYIDSAGFKSIPEYTLRNKIVLGPGTYFIGFQQLLSSTTSTGIPVGFDKNYDHSGSTFYNVGSGWKQSQIKGSVMLRPVFGKQIPPPVGMREFREEEKTITIFPNPSAGDIFLRTNDGSPKVLLVRNALGQVILEEQFSGNNYHTRLQNQPPGIYILQVNDEGGRPLQVQKLILRQAP